MSTEVSKNGMSFSSLLAIVFVTLKLCHVIDWSWWWVLSPLWIPASIVILVLVVILVLAAIKK